MFQTNLAWASATRLATYPERQVLLGINGYQVRDGRNCFAGSWGDLMFSQSLVVIIDEAHERTINTDVLIGLLSRIVGYMRPALSTSDPPYARRDGGTEATPAAAALSLEEDEDMRRAKRPRTRDGEGHLSSPSRGRRR
jgi:hypothetical protein